MSGQRFGDRIVSVAAVPGLMISADSVAKPGLVCVRACTRRVQVEGREACPTPILIRVQGAGVRPHPRKCRLSSQGYGVRPWPGLGAIET